MNTVDRWTDKGIENAIKEATNEFNRTAIVNGTVDIYHRPPHWMEKMWATRIVFKLYHKIRNWLITL